MLWTGIRQYPFRMKRTFQEKAAISKKIGLNIRALRNSRGWSQAQLAEKANIHETYVGFLETGTRNVTAYMLVRFSRALNCKPSDLFKGIS